MIEIKSEKLLSLAEATQYVPRRRRGRKTSVSTLYRWASPAGHRGVRLETLRVGGSLCTSAEALQRFFNKLTESEQTTNAKPAASRRHLTTVEQRLADYGL